MKLLSKKKLFEFLDLYVNTRDGTVGSVYFRVHGLKARGISNETYGSKSCIYVSVAKTKDERNALERELRIHGFKVNRNYWPESTLIEVQVSYFKGHHWDE